MFDSNRRIFSLHGATELQRNLQFRLVEQIQDPCQALLVTLVALDHNEKNGDF